MKFLLVVNESPWGSTLALAALRFARAVVAEGFEVGAVYFRDDGVYNALPGRSTDAGTEDLARGWAALARDRQTPLLICSAAAGRRLPGDALEAAPAPFRPAGLVEMVGLMERCDRVVSF